MARGRSLAEFQQEFPNDESCAAFLIERRWPDGFVCPGCGERRPSIAENSGAIATNVLIAVGRLCHGRAQSCIAPSCRLLHGSGRRIS